MCEDETLPRSIEASKKNLIVSKSMKQFTKVSYINNPDRTCAMSIGMSCCASVSVFLQDSLIHVQKLNERIHMNSSDYEMNGNEKPYIDAFNVFYLLIYYLLVS